MPDRIAYKILTDDEFGTMRREGSFRGSPVDLADGFVHLSSAAQVTETADRHFRGRTGLVVAVVDLSRLGDAVRWEASRGGQLFPHLYGALPLGAVIAAGPLERKADGTLLLPG